MSSSPDTARTADLRPERTHVARLYHPSHHVPDLGEAAEFFSRAFGLPTRHLSEMFADAPPGIYPTSYSSFTAIAEVLFDCIDPTAYVLAGTQRYASVDVPVLRGMGWYVDDMASTFAHLRDMGVEMVDQLDQPADGPEPPAAATSPMPLFFTTPETAGLRFELVPAFPFPLDHRVAPGWQPSTETPEGSLGILACSHHTILSDRPERVSRFLTEGLGGTVVHEARNHALAATSTYVALADATYEVAEPDEGGSARRALVSSTPADLYHSLTWQVVDLDRVATHLRSVGVELSVEDDALLVTDPATSLGVPWGFTTDLVPGDPRRAALAHGGDL